MKINTEIAKKYLEYLPRLRKQIHDREEMLKLVSQYCIDEVPCEIELEELKEKYRSEEAKVKEVILSLPDGYGKTALYLRYICGQSMKVIATELYISRRTLGRHVDKSLELIYEIIYGGGMHYEDN